MAVGMLGLLFTFLIINSGGTSEQSSKTEGWPFIIDIPELGDPELKEPIVESPPNEAESVNVSKRVQFSSNVMQGASVSYGYLENGYVNDLLDLQNEMKVQDINTGQEFPLGQLAGQKILTVYRENDKEVYFLGQYSKNCNWDGYCITNVYNSNGTLYGICEYNFRDGESLTCKSLYDTGKEQEWICVDKQYDGDESYGESIRYSFEYDMRKDFSGEDVEDNDIIYIDEFLEKTDAIIHSYYKGRISNGKYNDQSGEAFLITYFEPSAIEGIDVPVIETLYNGKFEDGQFSEKNYDSWYITRSINTSYMYYKGGFSAGEVHHKEVSEEDFEYNLTHEQIDAYLDKYGFSEYSDQFIIEYEAEPEEPVHIYRR